MESHRAARMRDVPRACLAHATGSFARKPRWLRWLAFPFAVLNLPVVAEWVARGELFITDGGSLVVMTPARRRQPLRGIRGAAFVGIVVTAFVVPCALAVAAVILPVTLGAVLVAVLLLAYLLFVASYAVLAFPRVRGRDRDEKPARAALGAGTQVVRLHDLVRSPRAARGSGVALLSGILDDPHFQGAVIIATAAHETLARHYEAAGMTRVRPGSLTVIRHA